MLPQWTCRFHPTFSLRHFNGETVAEVPIPKITGEVLELEEEVAMMAKAVQGAGPLWATGEERKWSIAMCLKAQESVDAGGVVRLAP